MTPRDAVTAFYSRIWNAGDKAAIADLLHPDFIFRGSLRPTMTGHSAFAAYADMVRGVLAEYRCIILDLVTEGDRAFARMRFEGIHRGAFMGFAPTGEKIEWLGAALFTIRAGKIVDLWVLGDVHGLRELLTCNAKD